MKIAYNWLKEYIKIEKSVEETADILTASGLEVEGIADFEEIQGNLEGLVIGEVLTCEKHQNADKLSVTTVDIGGENPSPIVCGASNVKAGIKVIVATVGATLYPINGEPFQIKKAKIRGEASQGMICAEDEIGLGVSHEGIMVLDTDLPNGTAASEYFNLEQDKIIEIGLTPNRADATSHIGVARDLKVLLKEDLTKPSVENFKIDNQSLPIEVKVNNTEASPRYSGLCIKGVKVEDSPKWLQNRLKSIGLSPINNIVDITNFVLHELGQPLHAFDYDEITGQKVIIKTLTQDTKFTTLDEKERQLSEHDLMICNEEEGMCIAGVFGGIKSGVSEKTQNIFLESAYFSPASIRKTAQYHGLKTDASFRFERGTDPNITIYALKRAALLIQEIAGGEIASEIIDIYPNPIENFDFQVKYKNIDRLIGKVLDRDLIKEFLLGLEIEISKESEEGFKVSVPPYRVDVQREADIIEEIIRLYGYNNIEFGENLGSSYLANFPKMSASKIQNKIAELLASNGFSEILNNSLTKAEYSQKVKSFDENKNVVILNQLSEDLGVMRQTLLFGALEAVIYNINRRQKDLKVFEFGKIYQKTEETYFEEERLALLVTGNRESENWINTTKTSDFHTLASPLKMIFQKMHLQKLKFERFSDDIFADALVYTLDKVEIAKVGVLKQEILDIFGIEQSVFYADIAWQSILQKQKKVASSSHPLQYKSIPKFPEVRRDLSLVLDKGVTFEEIKTLALEKERKLIKSIQVFDVYEGKNIEEGKKAYALSFILQDEKQTLKDKVIEKTMKKLMQAFEQNLGALIRK